MYYPAWTRVKRKPVFNCGAARACGIAMINEKKSIPSGKYRGDGRGFTNIYVLGFHRANLHELVFMAGKKGERYEKSSHNRSGQRRILQNADA
jgi:hypothetical protein